TSCPQELCSGCFWREVLAEAVATLIFTGVVLGASTTPGPLVPAVAGGLVAVTLTCVLGAPQANPALTLALLCTRKLRALRGAAVLLAQCAGAVLAATAARLALPDDAGMVTRVSVPVSVLTPVPVGAEVLLCPQVSAVGTAGQALCWEIFATFQLALTAFATTNHAAVPAGLTLGSAIIAGALAAGPFSGGSMNPARSLGPAIVTGVWDNHWVSHSTPDFLQRPHCRDG
ncbi:AQP4 protein, partial [Odontophorus gujanensis]|nr:AQP4 protein [Odontophorus gujanensis]